MEDVKRVWVEQAGPRPCCRRIAEFPGSNPPRPGLYCYLTARAPRAHQLLLCLPPENLMSGALHTVSDGRLLRLALNRPDKRNALNLELCLALVEALEAADRDPGVGAILLTGNGKSFCAGMDLHEIADADTGAISQIHEQLFTIGAR